MRNATFGSVVRAWWALATGLRPLAVLALVLGSGCPHVCDSNSCPDGCCGDDGICWIDNTQDKCGLGGRMCQACTAAQTCTLGQCVNKCNASNCPNGCCNQYGSCTTPTSYRCGLNGASCQECAIADECSQGQCVPRCRPANCTGGCCSTYGSCFTASDSYCGLSAAACQDCTVSGLACTAAGTCGTCSGYGVSCGPSIECCAGYRCLYDSFYGDLRCKF